jgi:hypothetical protein
MSGPVIETPRGKVFLTRSGTKAKLEWNTNFQPKYQERFTRAQKFVDNEVLRRSEPYIPLLTGMLIKSGILGTVPGRGVVSWIAVYARKNYYSARKPGSQTGPLRGPHWFERMKQVDGRDIVTGARRIAGGRR